MCEARRRLLNRAGFWLPDSRASFLQEASDRAVQEIIGLIQPVACNIHIGKRLDALNVVVHEKEFVVSHVGLDEKVVLASALFDASVLNSPGEKGRSEFSRLVV